MHVGVNMTTFLCLLHCRVLYCHVSSGFLFSLLPSCTEIIKSREILVWISGISVQTMILKTLRLLPSKLGDCWVLLSSLLLSPGILLPWNILEWMSLHTKRHNHLSIIESWKNLVERDSWRLWRSGAPLVVVLLTRGQLWLCPPNCFCKHPRVENPCSL